MTIQQIQSPTVKGRAIILCFDGREYATFSIHPNTSEIDLHQGHYYGENSLKAACGFINRISLMINPSLN